VVLLQVHRFAAVVFLAILALIPSLSVRAEPVRSGHVRAELVATTQSVRPGEDIVIALRMVHDEGWHSYWKNSTTGLPTQIAVAGLPPGVRPTVMWPAPVVHVQDVIVDYVYKGDVLIPLRLPYAPSMREDNTYRIRADVSWLVCNEACEPGGAKLELDLPVSDAAPQPDPAWSGPVGKAVMDAEGAPSGLWTVSARQDGRKIILEAHGDGPMASVPGRLYFFSDDGLVEATPSQSQQLRADGVVMTLELSQYAPAHPATLNGMLVAGAEFEPGFRTLGVHVPVAASSSLAGALVFGFLGGLILNLMPCVFPVLGLKVLSLVKQAAQSRRAAWTGAAAFTAGVVASLWLLAGLMLALRSAGESVGWGFQLQNPAVLFIGFIVFLLFGLNMLGVYEIGLGATGVGVGLDGRAGLVGAFLGGVLAVAVATPCSAPFIGTAMSYAMVQPWWILFVVFGAVGLGFSLPYLMLAAFPRLLGFLPKPGLWMVRLRQVLSLLLFATAAYLAWVLTAFMGGTAQYLALGASAALTVAATIIYGRYGLPHRSMRVRTVAVAAAALLLVGAVVVGWPGSEPQAASAIFSDADIRPAFTGDETEPHYIAWRPGLAERLAAQGGIVWVDFTARWCATCQVNKAAMFSSQKVRQFFREHKVYALKADWTRKDEPITRELESRGRYAVPYNLIYARGKEPDPLPTILTPGIVLEHLEAAAR
jgi:thiol:disulfide interchange protein